MLCDLSCLLQSVSSHLCLSVSACLFLNQCFIFHVNMIFISFYAGTVRRFMEKYPDALETLLFVCSDDTYVSGYYCLFTM